MLEHGARRRNGHYAEATAAHARHDRSGDLQDLRSKYGDLQIKSTPTCRSNAVQFRNRRSATGTTLTGGQRKKQLKTFVWRFTRISCLVFTLERRGTVQNAVRLRMSM
jgi:hypothetical protein